MPSVKHCARARDFHHQTKVHFKN